MNSSIKIARVLPATSATQILMSGCPGKTQSKDKKPFPFEVPRYGTAFLLRLNWHPRFTNSKNIRVDRFLGGSGVCLAFGSGLDKN